MTMNRIGMKLIAWLRIARLQFYPMTWLAYTMGAVAQSAISNEFKASSYMIGYAVLFLIEFCTILVNEYNDYETDRLNKNFSMFTGGTRVIVEGRLSFREVKVAIAILVCMISIMGYLLFRQNQADSQPAFLLIIAGLLFGLGYTLAPLKFSYHGVGEIVVSVTHSIYVILCGVVFQGGAWNGSWPWLISVPLFFSILAAITLAGIPDREADEAVGKRTFAVIFGARASVIVAIWCSAIAYLSAFILGYLGFITISIFFLNVLVLPHGAVLLYYLFALRKSVRYKKRIDREMGLSLSYIIWFALIPLFSFWQ
jgi:1,4-dihydroxy-2-naphthoate polyprenyltransferase